MRVIYVSKITIYCIIAEVKEAYVHSFVIHPVPSRKLTYNKPSLTRNPFHMCTSSTSLQIASTVPILRLLSTRMNRMNWVSCIPLPFSADYPQVQLGQNFCVFVSKLINLEIINEEIIWDGDSHYSRQRASCDIVLLYTIERHLNLGVSLKLYRILKKRGCSKEKSSFCEQLG